MQFGYELDTNNVTEIAKTLNKLLVDVKGLPEANMIENLAVRTMQKLIILLKILVVLARKI
jgi:hypothetical protein